LLLLAGAATDILVDPDILLLEGLRLLLLLRLMIALISRTLATAGALLAGALLLFLHSCYLCRSIPVIRPFISSLVPVIRAIVLPWSPGAVGVPLSLPLSL
jgi:hypothetical protein